MAQEAVDAASRAGGLTSRACPTAKLTLHYASLTAGPALHPALPYSAEHVLNAIRHEMARTVADVLARRTRALILDARIALEIAPRVASLMAAELGQDENWQQAQTRAFQDLAQSYLPGGEVL
jgi:glycerol-3-phosphate dehydrogenase